MEKEDGFFCIWEMCRELEQKDCPTSWKTFKYTVLGQDFKDYIKALNFDVKCFWEKILSKTPFGFCDITPLSWVWSMAVSGVLENQSFDSDYTLLAEHYRNPCFFL